MGRELARIRKTPIPYDHLRIKRFQLEELFEHGRLHQGWGIPKLDLRQSDQEWIRNYILGAWQFWTGTAVTTEREAAGRKHILDRMKDMAVGDIVFVPNVTRRDFDRAYFAVAAVKAPYRP